MTTKTNEEWEKEYDKLLTPGTPIMAPSAQQAIKNFIRTLLTQKDKETALAVEKERERVKGIADSLLPIQNQKEHNNAVLRLNNILTPQ